MYRQRSYFWQQLIAALIASAALTLLLRWAGLNTMTAVLFIVLTIFFFYAGAIFRALLHMSRRRMRPFGRGNGGGRGDWSGEREPRHPHPPYWPPRAAEVTAEEPDQPKRAAHVADDDPQHSQPLRSENDVA